MLIAVPSKSRAGLTTTNKILPSATFYVPKSEIHQYQSLITNVVAVPNDVQGITPTRNWILKNTKEKYVVFIDDDVKTCGYVKLHERKSQKIDIKEENFWLEQFLLFFKLCEQMQYKIWGVRTESAPRGTHPYKPFLFHSYVTASCMGMINDGEYYFNEKFIVKEDYEICLRHIVEKGGILAVRYLHWENEHWTTDGGCKSYRTVNIERQAIKDLIELYPNYVKSVKRTANEFTIQLNF
jgi:hypothetical protein